MNKVLDTDSFKRLFPNSQSLLVVIPARSGSKRFPDKNIASYRQHPLFVHSALAAQSMSCRPRVIVSTDSPSYRDICDAYNIESLRRPAHLSCDSSPKLDAITHVVHSLYNSEKYLPRHVLSLQANSLGITTELLNSVFTQHEGSQPMVLKETISINDDGQQNGAIRLMNIATLFQPSLSTYLFTYTHNLIDVHYPEDLL